MKVKLAVAMGSILLLGACASTSSEYYASVQHANEQRAQVEIARAQAEVERLKALQNIAYSGDETARTAAVMALAISGSNNTSQSGSTGMVAPRQPESAGDTALRWASVLLPTLTNVYGINRNSAIQGQQIEANKDISIHSNETMLGFGRLAAGQQVPIIGGPDERLIYPVNPIVGQEGDVLLYPEQ